MDKGRESEAKGLAWVVKELRSYTTIGFSEVGEVKVEKGEECAVGIRLETDH